MSAHRALGEQLSAYLDGELPAAGARPGRGAPARVRALRAAGWRSWPRWTTPRGRCRWRAPEGYFDAFPGRVRARLAAPPRAAASLPVWTWAAAAAVLLAVVTPLACVSARPAAAAGRGPRERRRRPAPRATPRPARRLAAPRCAVPATTGRADRRHAEPGGASRGEAPAAAAGQRRSLSIGTRRSA